MGYGNVVDSANWTRPWNPLPLPGGGGSGFGSGFNNIRLAVSGSVVAVESYPPAGTAGGNQDSPYQTPAATGSDPVTPRAWGGTSVSPPNPVQVFSSREPNDQGQAPVPGPIQPADVG
jgi:hypothetical protein